MHEFDYDTLDCDFNKYKSDSYTQTVILTSMRVIMTFTSDYDTHGWDLFTHELNFNTMRVILTRTN
jgi:hypothetical protein